MNFAFGKEQKLKSENAIKALFNQGFSLFVHPIRGICLFSAQEVGCKVLVSVSKKNFKNAVDRNLIKRRMREAYRLNSTSFKEVLSEKKMGASIAFIYISNKILDYKDIEIVILKQLNGFLNKIPSSEESC